MTPKPALEATRRRALREAAQAARWDYVRQTDCDLRNAELLALLDAADAVDEAETTIREDEEREALMEQITRTLNALELSQLHEALGLLQGRFPIGDTPS